MLASWSILPLCRMWSNHWERVGLVFGMDGRDGFFSYNEADDLVYFGRGSQTGKARSVSPGQSGMVRQPEMARSN